MPVLQTIGTLATMAFLASEFKNTFSNIKGGAWQDVPRIFSDEAKEALKVSNLVKAAGPVVVTTLAAKGARMARISSPRLGPVRVF